MSFLETDVQGSDHVCRDLMDDLEAVEDGTDDAREFTGNAHAATLSKEGVTIVALPAGSGETYSTALKHFREVLEDWEAFILDDQPGDSEDDLPV